MVTILEDKYLLNQDSTYLLQENGDNILLNYQITARHLKQPMVLVRDKA